jgi:hypothetical protein
MKEKVNLSKVHVSKFFYSYVYPILAKEFLFMSNYEQFANVVSLNFILTSEQWEFIVHEWELKEIILS